MLCYAMLSAPMNDDRSFLGGVKYSYTDGNPDPANKHVDSECLTGRTMESLRLSELSINSPDIISGIRAPKTNQQLAHFLQKFRGFLFRTETILILN